MTTGTSIANRRREGDTPNVHVDKTERIRIRLLSNIARYGIYMHIQAHKVPSRDHSKSESVSNWVLRWSKSEE